MQGDLGWTKRHHKINVFLPSAVQLKFSFCTAAPDVFDSWVFICCYLFVFISLLDLFVFYRITFAYNVHSNIFYNKQGNAFESVGPFFKSQIRHSLGL